MKFARTTSQKVLSGRSGRNPGTDEVKPWGYQDNSIRFNLEAVVKAFLERTPGFNESSKQARIVIDLQHDYYRGCIPNPDFDPYVFATVPDAIIVTKSYADSFCNRFGRHDVGRSSNKLRPLSIDRWSPTSLQGKINAKQIFHKNTKLGDCITTKLFVLWFRYNSRRTRFFVSFGLL